MSVDIDLIRLRRNIEQTGKLDPDADFTVTVDRIALRKNWQRAGKVSYWVSLVFHQKLRLYQVFREWRWYDKTHGQWVEGNRPYERPTENVVVVSETFTLAVQGAVQGKGYVVDHRKRTPSSPLGDLPFAESTPQNEEPQDVVVKEEPAPEPDPLRRKGERDWW